MSLLELAQCTNDSDNPRGIAHQKRGIHRKALTQRQWSGFTVHDKQTKAAERRGYVTDYYREPASRSASLYHNILDPSIDRHKVRLLQTMYSSGSAVRGRPANLD